MKKKIYITIPLLMILIYIINVGEVRAGITGTGSNELGGSSTNCYGGFCANSTFDKKQAYGIRVTMVDTEKTNPYLHSVDYWLSDKLANYVQSNCKLSKYGFHQQYNYKYNGTVVDNNKIQDILSGMTVDDETGQVKYKDTLSSDKFLNEDVLKEIIGDINNIYGETYSLVDVSKDNIYFLIEPIFLINVYNVNYHHYSDYTDYRDLDNLPEIHVAGTAKEIIPVLQRTGNGFVDAMLDTCFYGKNSIYLKFGQNDDDYYPLKTGWDFIGPWNVINNYLIDPYYDGSNINNFINGVKLKSGDSCFTESGAKNYEDIVENASSGLSKYVVKASKFGVETPKTCQDRLNEILNNDGYSDKTKISKLKDLYNDFPSYNGLIAYGDEENPDFGNVSCRISGTTPKTECTTKLKNIKESDDSDVAKIEAIEKLYEEYGFTDLLNYTYDNDNENLDISQVRCNSSCNSTTNGFSCDYSSIPLVTKKGCYNRNESYKYEATDDIYCTTGYEITLSLENDKFTSSMMVWPDDGKIDKYVKTLTLKYNCSSTFTTSDYSEESGFSNKLFGELPEIKIDGNLLEIKEEGDWSEGAYSICNGEKCYYQWEGSKTYTLRFPYYASKSGDGIWVLYEELSNEDKDEYGDPISGLPSPVDAESGDYEATVEFIIDGNTETLSCPYKLKQELLGPPDSGSKEFDFDFRIIDTNNPFSGISGKSIRSIGHNWCLDYYIGTKLDGNLIGDVNGDKKVDNNDVDSFQRYFAGYSSSVKVSDNTYLNFYSDTSINSADVMRLSKVLSIGYDYNPNDCSAENLLVEKYITEAKDSYSTEKPMYTFTLNSSDIKAIRQYNENNSYSDFNLDSDEDGNYISSFLTSILNGAQLGTTGSTVSKPSSDSYLCNEKRVGEGQFCSNSINNES